MTAVQFDDFAVEFEYIDSVDMSESKIDPNPKVVEPKLEMVNEKEQSEPGIVE